MEWIYVVEQFSMILSILTFQFDLILGSFFTFWGPNGPFSGLGWGLKTVLVSPHTNQNFYFQSIGLFLLYHIVFRSFLDSQIPRNHFWWDQNLDFKRPDSNPFRKFYQSMQVKATHQQTDRETSSITIIS